MSLLQINNLSVVFDTESGKAQAVDELSLSVAKGTVLGVVGESGCGKSITSLSILRLIPPPGRIVKGEIIFDGQNLLTLSEAQMRSIRGNSIALIPQDPMTSLNPVYTIGDQIIEAIELHQKVGRQEARKRAIEVLDRVRIPEAATRVDDYPHQFSGGMRQRVMIAMALSCKPRLLIADEPTTALDVTVQAQILDLLREIQKAEGMSIVLITHDLGVVAEMCDNVAVMYAGSIVEYTNVKDLFASPKHPYTSGLLNSIPSKEKERLVSIEGQPPGLIDLPPGCRFLPRCPLAETKCQEKLPPLELKAPGHTARCVVVQPEPELIAR
jgi:peptide/nickel transport system ATP-binding protein/oligopeptide transport system ATP-binding protein